jgi:peptidoglycan/xylan/chitin deacetylase (PgdA/CDA1 family)
MSWLPPSKRAAVCFSVDDVHPAPVAREALGHVEWLQERHPQLRVTLFTTPDWRTLDPYPTSRLLASIPYVRDHVFTVAVHPRGTFRLDRHEAFCAFLRQWPGAEIALHGLHHVRTGLRPVLELEGRSTAQCRAILEEAMSLFERARLPIVRGMTPPGWHASPQLLQAMHEAGLAFVASARDLDTPVTAGAVASGSGLRGVPLFRPERIEPGLLHIPTNFQATSTFDRALAILDAGGLLSIKAHLLVESGAYRALDGLSPEYREHLHRLFSTIEERFGEGIWWTSMGELAS